MRIAVASFSQKTFLESKLDTGTKNSNTYNLWPSNPPLGISPLGGKVQVHNNLFKRVFIAALILKVKIQKLPEYPSNGD